jgi:hypothetical protein
MLAGKNGLKEQVKKRPHGEVLLYDTKENTKQKRILERVKEVFRHFGYAVTLLPIEQTV